MKSSSFDDRLLEASIRSHADADSVAPEEAAVDDLAERLEHDHRAISGNDAEELVLGRRAAKRHVEAQLVAIEREGGWNISDDEKR